MRSVSSVVKPSSSSSGSALILTLLITALLATIAVSFLSTSRVEQIAAKNFSRQNAASGLAELATQQAMAKIQQGFKTINATTGSSSGNTTQIVTTQPGRITKYFFLNGNCTSNATTNLYSTNGTVRADLNNLQNPENTTQVRGNNSDNQTFTITGNASNRLIVNMEDITSNGTLIGRVAYYTDDELTKININGATDNRTTLNVSTARSMSLSAITTGNLSTFRSIVDGTITNNTSNLTNWGYFFRKEQADKVTGFTGSQMSNISTAPLSDFHLKYTPWGTRRLHINDEPLNATGVNNVYEALAGLNATTGIPSANPNQYEINGWALRNIYGQTFNDKYGQNWSWTGNMSRTANTTVNGLKQTIANMLQMRTPGSHDVSVVQGSYAGPVISENGTATFPPTGYYADIPAGCINEFGFKINYKDFDEGPGMRRGIILYPMPIIELVFASSNPYGDYGNVFLEATVQSLTFTLRDSLGNTTTRTIGPFSLKETFNLEGSDKCVTNGSNGRRLDIDFDFTIQQNIFNTSGLHEFRGNNNLPWTIVGNPALVMGDVKLYAGSSNASAALRDWLLGSFINRKLGNGTIVLNTPIKTDPSDHLSTEAKANFKGNATLQRIDSRVKGETAWVVAQHTYPRDYNEAIYAEGGANRSNIELAGHNTFYYGLGLRPSETGTRDIPGDPSPLGFNEPDWFITTEASWVYLPRKLYTLDSSGNATFNSPNDLGKVSTNVNWRRLRFMPRHKREVSTVFGGLGNQTLIPDWAMLDVISFSSNSSSSSNLKIAPINPNGSFALDTLLNTSPTAIPSPRNNLAALVKALESTSATDFQLRSALASTVNGSIMTFDKIDMRFLGADFVRFRGNTPFATSISGNITSNSTAKWSTVNSTWSAWRTAPGRNWPATSLILPGEVTEIRGVADYGPRNQYQYFEDNGTPQFSHSIKENEGRLSAFFPGLTTCSNFFTIYAYAQAGQLQNKNQPEGSSNPFEVDSEALTKSLVEVEITKPATESDPAEYKVKKLYTQPIPLGQ